MSTVANIVVLSGSKSGQKKEATLFGWLLFQDLNRTTDKFSYLLPAFLNRIYQVT